MNNQILSDRNLHLIFAILLTYRFAGETREEKKNAIEIELSL